MSGFSACAVVPTYDNPDTLGTVVGELHRHLEHVIVVDDGSEPPVVGLPDSVDVVRFEANRGKGAAVLAGLQRAADRGFTHALQIDADDQHDSGDVPRFLAAAEAAPEALICGVPVFGPEAPRSRVIGRKISVFWVDVEVGRGVIRDPLYGFRVYPVRASLAAGCKARRMGFDTEIAVRLAWRGTPLVHLDSKVRYFDGGVTHFRPWRSNWALSRMHCRLFFRSLWWRLTGR